MFRRLVSCFLAGSALLVAACPVSAATYALLVGVSGYPTLPQSLRLQGPANDILLIRSALFDQGMLPANVTVLADRVGAVDGLPTRANILAGFDKLASQAKDGDWVVVYLAGHGSQQPQVKKNGRYANGYQEPDGLDEIFLPYDIGAWNGKQGKVEGAIIDDEIGVALDKITQRGAYVWAVFDTCHAAGMTRAFSMADDAPLTRYVTPARLGIPASLINTSKPNPIQPTAPAKLAGRAAGSSSDRLIAFFAAQKDEPAQEESLPKLDHSSKPGKQYDGVFTYSLVKSMAQWRGSFKELAAQVAAQYSDRPYPTPIFSGNLASSPNFAPRPDLARKAASY